MRLHFSTDISCLLQVMAAVCACVCVCRRMVFDGVMAVPYLHEHMWSAMQAMSTVCVCIGVHVGVDKAALMQNLAAVCTCTRACMLTSTACQMPAWQLSAYVY